MPKPNTSKKKPFLAYACDSPCIYMPQEGGAFLEKLIIEAALEAVRLGEETYFNQAMDSIECAIRCAQHVLDHRDPMP